MRVTFSGIFVALLIAGCSGDSEYSLDVSIPDSVRSLEEAIEYVRQVESDRGGAYLYQTDEARITSAVAAIPEVIPPDFLVLIFADDRTEALRIKQDLGAEIGRIFDRWDVCEIDIAWDMYVGGMPVIENPNGDFDLDETYINPGCDKPAVEDHWKPGAEDYFR